MSTKANGLPMERDTGYGLLTFPDGSKYEGVFEAGKYQGYGVYCSPDGIKYEGQFNGGHARGKGLITFADGTHGCPRNEGKFDDNKCLERCLVPEAIQKAREAASSARKKAQRLL
eukprot:Em0004g1359a